MKDLQQMAEKVILEFEFGGQVRKFNFGKGCHDEYCRRMGCTRETEFATFQGPQMLKALHTFIFCAIIAADRLDGRSDSVTELEVMQWIFTEPDQTIAIMHSAAGQFLSLSNTLETKTN